MKRSNIGIVVLIAIIEFTVFGCSNGTGSTTDSTSGSGQYTGKDVLGNSYSLSVGSDASRAAARGDRYTMTVTPRDGKTRTVTGTVKEISADGTLTLDPDAAGDDFTAVVDGSDLKSVAGVGDEMPQIPFEGDPLSDGSQTLTPRTFDKVYLRANRWTAGNSETGPMHGEQYASGKSVLLRDFPTNVSTLQPNDGNRYSITVSGTSDIDLDFIRIEVQGLTENDEWEWIAGYYEDTPAKAGVLFTSTGKLDSIDETIKLLDYKEIILQFTNVSCMFFDEHPEWDEDVDNEWRIPADIPQDHIMATISNFKIELKDDSRAQFAGNMDDFNYGIREDGMSLEYTRAAWILTSDNIQDAKKPGAKFEFVMTGLNGDDEVSYDYLEEENISLSFVWQDPDRGLWWNEYYLVGKHEDDNYATYQIGDGVEWIPWQKKIRIDIEKAVDSNFAASNKLSFEVGYWWRGGEDGETECIDELGISGANIIAPPASSDGNIGNWYYGYDSTGITFNLKQAVWHLPEDVLATAKTSGAKLEIEFREDISSLTVGSETNQYAWFALVWQGIDIDRWWPTDEEAGKQPGSDDSPNLVIFGWDSENEDEFEINGVTYDQTTKKLTIVLDQALETYNGSATSGKFTEATDVNLVLDCFYGVTDTEKIDEKIGIVSANIVAGN